LRVLENRLLRGLFGPRRVIRVKGIEYRVVIRTRRINGAGREAGVGVNINTYRILVVKREGEDTWKNYEVTGGER
jgi:hypothetical protein